MKIRSFEEKMSVAKKTPYYAVVLEDGKEYRIGGKDFPIWKGKVSKLKTFFSNCFQTNNQSYPILCVYLFRHTYLIII